MADVEELLSRRLGPAFDAVAGEPVSPAVRRSQHADFQADGALAVGRKLGISPREAAERVLRQADLSDLCSRVEVTGPGFISLTLADEVLGDLVAEIAGDDRLGSPLTDAPEIVTVDYSAPNAAKEMHAGHLRSTIIGDAVVRILHWLGHTVIRQNHIGEWGTPFGMLIEHLSDRLGLLRLSDGALCVFPAGFKNRQGEPLPLIVKKTDGGFGYAATDLATIRRRLRVLGATRLLYVVGLPQRQHLEMIFETAREAGWLVPPARAEHVGHGSILGEDGKILRTRAGASVKLIDLLDEAIARATAIVAEKNPALDEQARAHVAQAVGIGAVKYADLSTQRGKVTDVAGDLECHRLAQYLYGLASAFTDFYERCPVLRAEGEVRTSRLVLCDLTARTLKLGLGLLGIAAPDQM